MAEGTQDALLLLGARKPLETRVQLGQMQQMD